MSEVFEAKLRRVGNSLGIIIPNGILSQLGFGGRGHGPGGFTIFRHGY